MSQPIRSICLISPYIPKHFGGGERYFFSVAEYLSRGHNVTVCIPSDHALAKDDQKLIRTAYEKFLDLDLSNVTFRATPLFTTASFWTKLKWTRQFDVMYFLTDGSLFFSLAKRNILHIQVPFTHKLSFFDRLKLFNWQIKNTNSKFTKKVIERSWPVSIDVVHRPFVDIEKYQPGKRKEKIILHVGRFFTGLHTKRQDMLVKTFIKMLKKYPEQMAGWRLVLVGSVEDELYAQEVAKLAQGYPIEIIHNASQDELLALYGRSRIYWHATGYEVDEFIHPEKMEHFGITTIEAMASGVVPIVINKGGQKEIVEHGVSGFLWNEPEALIEKTLACIENEVDWKDLSEHARERAEEFSPERFYEQLCEMVGVQEYVEVQRELRVSAVIPNYNGQHLLKKHLPAVLQSLRDGDEVVIIDDASTDESVEWLKKEYGLKRVEDRAVILYDLFEGVVEHKSKALKFSVLQNVENVRFAESCNRAVKHAEHDLVFLLNTDVKPTTAVVDHLVRHFVDGRKKVFAVGCHEIEQDADGKQVHGGKNTLWFERGMFRHSRAKGYSSGETAWASGGSAMFDREKWLELDGFDLAYKPAYWEDIDLSYRAKQKGWKVLFDAEALVEHNHETTNKRAFGEDTMQVMSVKNAILFTVKNGSFLQKLHFIHWLPYHLTKTNKKMGGTFNKGLKSYIVQLIPQDW